MAATFIIDAPAVFALGVVTSLFAVDRREGAPFFRVWPFGHGLVMTALFFGTAVASYALEPEWMFMYFVPGPSVGTAGLAYMGILLYALPYVAGFALALEARQRARSLAAACLLGALAAQVMVVGGLWERYIRVGSLEAWRAGTAVRLPDHLPLARVSGTGGALIVMWLAGVALAYVPRWRAWRRTEPRYLNRAEEAIVAALAMRLLPGDRDASALARQLSRYIGSMTFPNRAGFRLVLFGAQWLPPFVTRVPSRFVDLEDAGKDAYLRALEHHPKDLLRMVLIVPKTLLSVLHYERPEVLATIGADYHCRQEARPPAFPDTPRVMER
ncbi:MAG: hypothetical protein U0166_24285 [Acidobacteriota bacterium]